MNTIKVNIGQEVLKSRTPGLFPYLEFDDNDICQLHIATDSSVGCYNHIVSSIRLPEDVNLVTTDNTGLITTPLEGGNVYSYRMLMDSYKQYQGHTREDDTFMEFMDYCIGKFYIDADIDWETCDLVPKYNYLAEVNRIYNEYQQMSIMVTQYLAFKEATGEVNCELECLVDKYERLGGDVMRDYYGEKCSEAEERAAYIYTLAEPDDLSIAMNFCVVSTENDLGYLSTYLNFWEPEHRYYHGDMVTYNDRTYICTGVYEDGVDVGTIGKWNSLYEEYVFDDEHFVLLTETFDGVEDNFEIDGVTDSKLNGFRKQTEYLNMAGDVEIPSTGTDWLYYYKIGNLGHYETTTDTLGNIEIQEGYERELVVGEYDTHLMAYGDIITNIEYDENEHTISFHYIVGANLKARLIQISVDDDNNERFFYDDYLYNEDDAHGIEFIETYYYPDDGEIAWLINNGTFDYFVNTFHPDATHLFIKGEFDASSMQVTSTAIVNGLPVNYQTNISSYHTSGRNSTEALVAPITKVDYMVGVSYPPFVNADIFIGRGNAAAWERHLKLGEVKTFYDLENYSNNGFFNIQTTS